MLETPYTRDRVKGVLPAFVITGPNSNRDITSYAVLPAFVMRARLISRPHYVRLRIIAIHCDFSSESYIHIDPNLPYLQHQYQFFFVLIITCVHEELQY